MCEFVGGWLALAADTPHALRWLLWLVRLLLIVLVIKNLASLWRERRKR